MKCKQQMKKGDVCVHRKEWSISSNFYMESWICGKCRPTEDVEKIIAQDYKNSKQYKYSVCEEIVSDKTYADMKKHKETIEKSMKEHFDSMEK